MTSYPGPRSYGDDSGGQATWLSRAEQLPEGSRRRKLAGYLKAANELRVTYQQSAQETWRGRDAADYYDDEHVPGEFPEAAAVRKGQDQLVVFPSYARKHVRTRPRVPRDKIDQSASIAQSRDGSGQSDAAFWREQWDKYEDDHAVVDVDVRGWLYTPHRGPMTRKQRIFVSLARQLAGLPNPPDHSSSSGSSTPGRSSSPHPMHDRLQAHNARKEEETAAKEAQAIVQKGQAAADNASMGQYSEKARKDADEDSLIDLGDEEPSPSRRTSSTSEASQKQPVEASPLKQVTNADAPADIDLPIKPFQKRASWNQPADMSPSELSIANANLMARLRPFMANPLGGMAISVFFYNDDTSQQRTFYTDPNGHFSVRVPLEFVPTHVRILATDELSATEEVIVTPTRGVSVISDIDDTIKHSAIASGAREIFRNAFIRDLNDLVIEGVKDLYAKLEEKGAKFHYVSNSPWQLYPVLTKYFKLAGLPPGSFHLKQYSGMLQGIFEPVAERKKSTLDKLARDFPERSFILFGDNGEADLEVYTDFVHDNPGRVLGVFIRDVTSSNKGPGFFSYSHDPAAGMSPGSSPIGSPPRSPRFSPRLSPRLSPKLNPANYFGSASKRRSLPRNSKSFSLDDDNDPELQAALKASRDEYEKEQSGSFGRQSITDRSIHETLSESREKRPTLPPRLTSPAAPQAHQLESDLIDLSDDGTPNRSTAAMTPADLLKPSKSVADGQGRPDIPKKPAGMSTTNHKTPSPQPPRKPASLHGNAAVHDERESHPRNSSDSARTRTPPPKPRRPSTSVRSVDHSTAPTSSQPPGYLAAAEQKLTSAYNMLPSVRDKLPNVPGVRYANGAKREVLPPPTLQQSAVTNAATSAGRRPPAPPPPRRDPISRSSTATGYGSSHNSGLMHADTMPLPLRTSTSISTSASSEIISPYSTRAGSSNASSTYSQRPGATGSSRTESWDQQQQQAPQVSRKEQLWRQRWLAASQTLRDKGVMLKSWKVGADIEKDVLGLMDEALEREKDGKGPLAKRRTWGGSSLEQ